MANGRITRRTFVKGTLGVAAAAGMSGSLASAANSPNILFILADDMGWGDLSCYGRPDYKTPNLDRLAAEGMLFTNAYSAAPVCTPTRVGFYTGRYPARLPVGLEEPIKDRKMIGELAKVQGIPAGHPTVASLLGKAGYNTALVGKWHVGYLPTFGPLKCGFQEFFGIMSGAGDFFTHKDMSGEADLFENEVPVERVGYITDLLTDKAIEYIKRPRKQPYFLSLTYTSPHWPWEGPHDLAVSKKLKGGYGGFTAGGSLKVYGEMVKNLDANIGRVLATLKATGQERKTLVIFTSDNGGERFSYNWPFTGQKFDVHEGGIRVPAIVRWPGVTRRGSRSDQPVITMDWTATIMKAAGAAEDERYPVDGIPMTDVLAGKRGIFGRTFVWRTYKQTAMRQGNLKFIREGKSEFLYDLSVDEHEQADVSSSNQPALARMKADLQKWESQMARYPSDKD